MQAALLYPPEKIGQREILTVSGNGPKSYSQTTGDPILLPPGLYIDSVLGNGVLSVSKTYYIRAYPSAIASQRAAWTLKWYVTSTAAETAGAVDLSAEQVQFSMIGGEF
jgi:hypothetical protein